MKQFRIRFKRKVEQTVEVTRYYQDQHTAEEYAPWINVPEREWVTEEVLETELEITRVRSRDDEDEED